jgi:hypothetical protein
MEIGYKLTNKYMQTFGGCQWEIGVEKTTSGEGKLCNNGWLHYYNDDNLAVIFNPIHANFSTDMRMFECKVEGIINNDRNVKFGCTSLTLIKEIPIPVITTVHRIAFAILCTKEVEENVDWNKWADSWLNKEDRSKKSANAAAAKATKVYIAAYHVAAAAIADSAAYYAAYYAAAAAAIAAAAYYAAADKEIDFVRLLEKAKEYL